MKEARSEREGGEKEGGQAMKRREGEETDLGREKMGRRDMNENREKRGRNRFRERKDERDTHTKKKYGKKHI